MLEVLSALGCALLMSGHASASGGTQQPSKEDSKISSLIRNLLEEMEASGVTMSNAADKQVSSQSVDGLLKVDGNGNVQVYIYLTWAGADQIEVLEDLDVLVELVNSDLSIVQGWIPFDRVQDVAALEEVTSIGV